MQAASTGFSRPLNLGGFLRSLEAGFSSCLNLGGFLRSSATGFSSCLNLGGGEPDVFYLRRCAEPASTWEGAVSEAGRGAWREVSTRRLNLGRCGGARARPGSSTWEG